MSTTEVTVDLVGSCLAGKFSKCCPLGFTLFTKSSLKSYETLCGIELLVGVNSRQWVPHNLFGNANQNILISRPMGEVVLHIANQ